MSSIPPGKYGEIGIRARISNMAPCRGLGPPSLRTLEDQAGVGAAKSERIRQIEFDLALARLLRHEIDFRCDRCMIEVERRRNDLIPDRQNRENRLDGTRRAEEMSDRRFRRGHGKRPATVARYLLDCPDLDFVAERRRGSMRVDIIDVAR